MAQFETIFVDQRKVSCNGGGGALGHPRVYLRIKENIREIECPYCSRRYVYEREDDSVAAGEHA